MHLLISLSIVFLFCTVSASNAAWKMQDSPLKTRWAKDVSPADPHPEYPRPQMVRKEWRSLNGLWNYAITPELGIEAASGQILVPFPVESALSGVMKRAYRMRYTRSFEVPAEWEGRVLLHFGAVDWQATVSLNGQTLGVHKGGYDPFSFDITDALTPGGKQELVVDVYDPGSWGNQPRGKQRDTPGDVFYTPVTGIWQTVWLESVPQSHIRDLIITPDVDRGVVHLNVAGASAEGLTVHAAAYAGNRKAGEATGKPGALLSLPIENPRLWSPRDAFLYRLKVSLRRDGRVVDAVDSYFGMRKVEVRSVGGVNRILLNGEFIFQVGTLDQGYWPDGLYTAPTDAALKWDLSATQALGFNMIRKHMKVEPARWYYYADKMGLLVWQDMPGSSSAPADKEQFERELRAMIQTHRNHPSILMWVPFNEGWGQFDTERITAMVKEMEPSRLVDNASGWHDKGVGHVVDTHRYPSALIVPPDAKRASVVGEFGGLGLVVPGHMWGEENWGYTGLRGSRDTLARNFENVFREVWAAKDDPGISAVVYTQITDIEAEANGLFTYDREVLKIPRATVLAATGGSLPPSAAHEGAAGS